MAKKTQAPERRPANLSADIMRSGITKLGRRLSDLNEFNFDAIDQEDPPEVDKLHRRIQATLDDVFGHDTVERHRYAIHSLWPMGNMIVGGGFYEGHRTSLREVREKYRQGFAEAAAVLQGAIEDLTEALSDLGETPGGRSLQVLQGHQLHSAIRDAVVERFASGHYADAVETACKVLNGLVQVRSTVFGQDGTSFMQSVFSPEKGILRFNDLASEHELGEQRGMMFLYAGVMAGLRNPRAHKVVNDDPDMALEVIGFISFLAKMLDRTKK